MRAEQNRAEDIDIFRAIGIVLMVMGHIGFSGYFDHFIHAFHMPMFFFVAGMFFNSSDRLSIEYFVRKKAKTTLLPYMVFGLFHFLLLSLLSLPNISPVSLYSLLFINTDNLPIAGALWFLTAFFNSNLIYYLVRRYVSCRMVYNIIIFCISLFGCFCTTILPVRLPWALDAAFVGVGLIHFGWMFKRLKLLNEILYMKPWKTILLGIVVAILIFINGYINMRTGTYAIIPMFWVNAIMAIIILLNISKYLCDLLPVPTKKIITSVGKNSIVYLCLNQLIIRLVSKGVNIVITSTVVTQFLILIFIMIILYLLQHIIVDTKLKFIVGK